MSKADENTLHSGNGGKCMLRLLYSATILTACISQSEAPSVTSSSMKNKNLQTSAAPARDGNIAIYEEFQAAVSKNTVEAYGLFIARHPDHELTNQAKIHQAKVQQRTEK